MAKKDKQNKSGGYLWVGLLAVGGLFFYLYRQALKIMVTGGYFRVHKLQGTNIELRVFLQISNESNITATVQNFLGQLVYKGTSLGIVSLVYPASLPPFSVKELEFKASISGLAFGTELYKIITDKSFQFNPQDMRVVGTLRAENLSVPINEALLSA